MNNFSFLILPASCVLQSTVVCSLSSNTLLIVSIKFCGIFNLSIISNLSKKNIINISNLTSVRFLENSDSFSDKEWNELYKKSEETFVEETESLKQTAAGAGLTDND